MLALLALVWLVDSTVESAPPVDSNTTPPLSSEADAPPTSEQVQRWVRDLGAPQLSIRSTAEQRLLEYPSISLQHFPERSTSFPPVQRDALRRLRGQLELLVARQESHASRLTLQGTSAWPDLLQQIVEQTGNRVVLSPEIDVAQRPAVSLSAENAPFWEVLLNLARQEQLELRSTSAGIELAPGEHVFPPLSRINSAEPDKRDAPQSDFTPPHDKPASSGWIDPCPHWVSGAFCLRLESIETSMLSASGEPQELGKLRWSLMVEPRLKPLYLTIAANRWQLTPVAITPFNPLAKYELGVDPQTGLVEWTQPFVGPPGWSQRAWELDGTGVLSLAAGRAKFVFDSLAMETRAVRRSGGVAVQVRGHEFTAEQPDLWTARLDLSVAYDTGGPVFESHRVGRLYQQARLIDGTKQHHAWLHLQPAQQGDGAALIRYEFRGVPGPRNQLHFEYEAPTLFTDVEFRFSDRD